VLDATDPGAADAGADVASGTTEEAGLVHAAPASTTAQSAIDTPAVERRSWLEVVTTR
jgi:hypothetical protein